ncbi:MAG TPA: ferredoxin, partial [Afipia sp.]|nr:ferredoxin [Afipia sp.]
MARITFVQPDGSENVVNIDSGTSVMLAAIRNGISGIDAECGGCLDCATCHVS